VRRYRVKVLRRGPRGTTRDLCAGATRREPRAASRSTFALLTRSLCCSTPAKLRDSISAGRGDRTNARLFTYRYLRARHCAICMTSRRSGVCARRQPPSHGAERSESALPRSRCRAAHGRALAAPQAATAQTRTSRLLVEDIAPLGRRGRARSPPRRCFARGARSKRRRGAKHGNASRRAKDLSQQTSPKRRIESVSRYQTRHRASALTRMR
jgi:hypothetical protein